MSFTMSRPPISKITRAEIFEEAFQTCVYCGAPATEIDHIFPFSFENTHRKENLVASCKECNLIASDKNFEDFVTKVNYIRAERKRKGLLTLFDYSESPPQNSPKRYKREIENLDPSQRKDRSRTRLEERRVQKEIDRQKYMPSARPYLKRSERVASAIVDYFMKVENVSKNKATQKIGQLIDLHPKTVAMIGNGGSCGNKTLEKFEILLADLTIEIETVYEKLVAYYLAEYNDEKLAREEICRDVASYSPYRVDVEDFTHFDVLSYYRGLHVLRNPEIRLAVIRLWRELVARGKPTVTIRYDRGDPRRARALSLSMEQRRERLDKEST